MKFVISKNNLASCLNHIKEAIESRTTNPILSNVMIETTNSNSISLKATNLELEITEYTEATIEQEGQVAVAALILANIITSLPNGADVELRLEETHLIITSGESTFNLPTLRSDEFPVLEQNDYENTLTISTDKLDRLINNTLFASSKEETHYYLNGVYLHSEGNKLIAVATDAHRLAKQQVEIDSDIELEGVIIPRKTVVTVSKLLKNCDNVDISYSNSKICFTFDKIIITSKLIDGNFPKYEAVIPASVDMETVISSEELAQAVKLVSTVSTDSVKSIKMELSQNVIKLSNTNSDDGRAHDKLDVEWNYDDFSVGFNADYLQEILRKIESNIVSIGFIDETSPVTLKDKEDNDKVFILMPMKV